ncbi:MAG: glycosyltransferase family 39 protein [Anaerolineae bacterium]|nr:glycosyltransferase family 39 protein [Anaerolineae bacterium]
MARGTDHDATKGRRLAPALAIVFLCVLAYGACTWRLEARPLARDEVLTLSRVEGGAPAVFGIGVHPPLYFVAVALFRELAGPSGFALRFISVAFAVLLVPLLYAAGARFWSRRTGLVAAALGALSPLYLALSQEARMYTMLAGLGLASIYALARGLDDRDRAWLIASVVSAAAAALTDYRAAVLIPVLGVQAIFSDRLPRPWRLGLTIGLTAALLVGLSAVAVSLLRLRAGTSGLQPGVLPIATLADQLRSLFGGALLPARVSGPLDALWLVLLLLGTLWPAARGGALVLAYLCLPLLAAVGELLVGRGAPKGYLPLLGPALYLGVAHGLERCTGRLRPAGVAAALILLGGMGVASYRQVVAMPRGIDCPYRELAQAIERGERPGDVIVVSGRESTTALLHYYRGTIPAVPLTLSSDGSGAGRVAAANLTADLASRFARVWLVRTDLSPARGEAEAWLTEHAFLADRRVYQAGTAEGLLELYLTQSPSLSAEPPYQHRSEVSFGGLRLEGYDLPLRPVAGGQKTWVTLYWRALAPQHARVSLRLVDREGRERARTDEVPYPALPPQRWPKNVLMRYEAGLAVPPALPPGWYNIELRVYDPISNRPIEPASGAAPGPLQLGPVLVEATWARPALFESLSRGPQVLGGRGMAFGEDLTLRAFRLEPEQVQPGEWVHVDLYWEVRSRPEGDLTLELALIDSQGTAVSSRVVSPVASWYPPAAWRAEELLWAQHDLLVPPRTRPGLYRLELRMRDASGRLMPIRDRWRFWTWGVDVATLGRVRVAQVPQERNLPRIQHRLDAGNTARVDLLGYDGIPERIRPGETLELTLYWRATSVPKVSYKVSVQMLDAQRSILAQDDSIPAGWSRPTTGWAAGEVVSDVHRLAVPASSSPQPATLIVALYDEDTGRRVQWFEGGQLQEYVVLCRVGVGE